jgi:amino acid transporter
VNGSVFLMLAATGTCAVMLWLNRPEGPHARRFGVWLFAIVGALLVVGVAAWQNALASLVTTEISLGVLLIVDVIGIFALVTHAGKKKLHLKHYHHARSPFLALAAGTALTLTFMDGINFLRQLQHAPLGTASALGQAVTRVQSGQAAQMARSSGDTTEVLAIAGVLLLVLLVLAHRHHSKKPAARTPAAITSGHAPGNAPARQVPAGKRGS